MTGLTKQDMPETMYRASRCCRLLGNPTAYLILRCLGADRMTPTELAAQLRIGQPTISFTLRHLREMDLVRYETRGNHKDYWVKDRRIHKMLDLIESWVESVRTQRG